MVWLKELSTTTETYYQCDRCGALKEVKWEDSKDLLRWRKKEKQCPYYRFDFSDCRIYDFRMAGKNCSGNLGYGLIENDGFGYKCSCGRGEITEMDYLKVYDYKEYIKRRNKK